MFGWSKIFLFGVVVLVTETQAGRRHWKDRERCEWVKCEPNCRKVKDETTGCYKCDCQPLCTPPKCGPGCEIQKVFDGPCPGCDCKSIDIDDIPLEKICEPVKCGLPCKEVPAESPHDCPKCVCEPPVQCDPPKCPPGCTIQTLFDGPCPGCDCKKDEVPDIKFPPKVMCSPVKCPPGCTVQEKFDGPCPGCDCKDDVIEEVPDVKYPPKVMCSPVKCPPGCTVQEKFDGPCPGCDCKEDEIEEIPDTKFPPKVMCSPLKCPPGCTVQEKFDGPCPGCDCKKEEEKIPICPEIAFICDGPKCVIEKDENGCDVSCKCEPECTPPKCKRWCKIKDGEDGCPVCDCPSWKFKGKN